MYEATQHLDRPLLSIMELKMGLLNRKSSLDRYSQALRPSVFGNNKPNAKRTAPWFGKMVGWANGVLPSQTKRTLWFSKPTTWSKTFMAWVKRLTPKQLKRTQWLNRMLSPFLKRSPFHGQSTFDEIKRAMDNSQFRHLSHPEMSPGHDRY